MALIPNQRIVPMRTAGTQHFIERTYREGGAFQWVRETFINAIEAGAKRIEFGIEWQAVENHGVYRRVIADNGSGMTAPQLVEFFNTFGGGGKPIGGAHENFGVGAKTSLLPWNKEGVVVISWVNGDPAMIFMQQDPESGEYGLRVETAEDENGEASLETVYEPYEDDKHGCNWANVKPEWISDHGTVIVLLGNAREDNTVSGDPTRAEADIKGISSYLNRRIWEVPVGIAVHVDELRTQERGDWPRNEAEAHSVQRSAIDRRTNRRQIQGAKYFVEYPVSTFKGGQLADRGTVPLRDGTEIDWYLWEGERPAVQSYSAISGFIAALYKNELYDVTAHHTVYRSFGVSEQVVRERVWLVVRPPLLGEDEKHGVYPRTDRNALLLRGGPNAGGPLPISEWATEFSTHLPDPILAAIRAARVGETGTIEDMTWRQRLADRFGARWRVILRRLHPLGTLTTDVTRPSSGAPQTRRIRRKSQLGSHSGGNGADTTGATGLGSGDGAFPARSVKVAGGIPVYRLVTAKEVTPGMLAAWHPNDPEYPEGAVLVNVEHPVIEGEVAHWQAQFADIYADQVRKDVHAAYGEIAVSKVAHSEHLKGLMPTSTIENELRTEGALTMALLGLIAEEAVLAPRLGGKFGKKIRAVPQ